MIKRLTSVLLLISALAIMHSPAASAHILRTDGEVSAEIHIPPYDHPLSGEPTIYLISFEKTPETFTIADCICNVTIIKQGRTLAAKTLAMLDGGESENSYTFPEAGDYTLRLYGSPKQAGQFANFILDFPAHVSKPKPENKPIPTFAWIGTSAGIVVLIVIAVITERSGRKKTPL
jgi:hypothetical protein